MLPRASIAAVSVAQAPRPRARGRQPSAAPGRPLVANGLRIAAGCPAGRW